MMTRFLLAAYVLQSVESIFQYNTWSQPTQWVSLYGGQFPNYVENDGSCDGCGYSIRIKDETGHDLFQDGDYFACFSMIQNSEYNDADYIPYQDPTMYDSTRVRIPGISTSDYPCFTSSSRNVAASDSTGGVIFRWFKQSDQTTHTLKLRSPVTILGNTYSTETIRFPAGFNPSAAVLEMTPYVPQACDSCTSLSDCTPGGTPRTCQADVSECSACTYVSAYGQGYQDATYWTIFGNGFAAGIVSQCTFNSGACSSGNNPCAVDNSGTSCVGTRSEECTKPAENCNTCTHVSAYGQGYRDATYWTTFGNGFADGIVSQCTFNSGACSSGNNPCALDNSGTSCVGSQSCYDSTYDNTNPILTFSIHTDSKKSMGLKLNTTVDLNTVTTSGFLDGDEVFSIDTQGLNYNMLATYYNSGWHPAETAILYPGVGYLFTTTNHESNRTMTYSGPEFATSPYSVSFPASTVSSFSPTFHEFNKTLASISTTLGPDDYVLYFHDNNPLTVTPNQFNTTIIESGVGYWFVTDSTSTHTIQIN